eukprot:CAMPEP_0194280106 /NCGR_PEP_ID=MMETSP0169-20130528/15908_1 /TAXON_ID=218684 /ORGANISM="Corethron pennatum, Strain L29A3" /LENGTH=1205 /DNA_ID=CAMNT_0039024707 /DNA_START=75 /DNA_END=3692 /DNA_ORIENTATION=+
MLSKVLVTLIVAAVSSTSLPAAFAGTPDFGSWPAIKSFTFSTPEPIRTTFDTPDPLTILFAPHNGETKLLSGKGNTECILDDNPNNVNAVDILDDIGIFKGAHSSGSCSVNDKYAFSDFLTEKGSLDDGSGKTYEAYKINHPKNDPLDFQFGITKLMFKVEGVLAASYIVYKAQPTTSGGTYALQVAQKDIVPVASGQFVMTSIELTNSGFNDVSDPPIFFVVPSDEALTAPESKTLNGSVNLQCDLEDDPTAVNLQDTVDKIGLYKTKYILHNDCFYQKKYSYFDFLTEKGELDDGAGHKYEAYKIGYPQGSPADFQAGRTHLMFKVKGSLASSYTVYKAQPRNEGDAYTVSIVEKGITVPTADQFVMTGVSLTDSGYNDISDAPIFFILPDDQALTVPIYKTLPGTLDECTIENDHTAYGPGDVVESFGIFIGKKSDGSCTTNKNYHYGNFLVEKGEVEDESGNRYEAYKVKYPDHIPTQWQSSNSRLMFKIEGALVPGSLYNVMKIQPPMSHPTVTVGDHDISVEAEGQYVTTSALVAPPGPPQAGGHDAIFFVVPAIDLVSAWPAFPTTGLRVEATIFSKDGLSLYAEVLGLQTEIFHSPFNPSINHAVGLDDYDHKYGYRKVYFPIVGASGDEGIVWQDQITFFIYVTWIGVGDDESAITIQLPENNSGDFYLLGAVSETTNGDIVYMLMDRTADSDNPYSALTVKAVKVNKDGVLITASTLDTSNSGGVNIHAYFSSAGTLAWNESQNSIAWFISREYIRGNDGLNHQALSVILLNPGDLRVVSERQVTSHSWNNYIIDSGDGFLSADLGDNYPRGIHVNKITPQGSITGHVVYTFKTQHGTKAQNPAGQTFPIYQDISNNEQTFYQWSNDNSVYTEMAQPALLELDDSSLIIVFAGEFPSLDSSQTGANLNNPRNIGIVKVDANDFTNVLSKGVDATGGFYTFNGDWSSQENKGIIQLTQFTSGGAGRRKLSSDDKTQWDNATRLKTAKLSNGNIVIVYEVWSSATYKRTEYMVIDSLGGVVTPSTFIPYALRLAPQDPAVMLYDDTVTIVGYDGLSLVRYHIQLGGGTNQCYERAKDRYYVKTDTDGEEVTKTCGHLAKKKEKKVKRACAKTKSGTTGAAKDVCKVTCEVCPCGEIDKSPFYPRPVKGEKKMKYNKCGWLASTKNDIKFICKSDRHSDKLGQAKVVCPVTCGTCPNK